MLKHFVSGNYVSSLRNYDSFVFARNASFRNDLRYVLPYRLSKVESSHVAQ